MKSFIILGSSLLMAASGLYYAVRTVSAAPGNNPNYVTVSQFENVMQSNLNLLWDSFEGMQKKMDIQEKTIEQLNSKLEAIQTQLEAE